MLSPIFFAVASIIIFPVGVTVVAALVTFAISLSFPLVTFHFINSYPVCTVASIPKLFPFSTC